MEAPVKDWVFQSLLEVHGMILDMGFVLAIEEAVRWACCRFVCAAQYGCLLHI